jgi:2-methylisocitrate lyase-like PEP mutase family enzyme
VAEAVGASIEDYDPSDRIYDLHHAVERVAAAAEAARRLGFPSTLPGRRALRSETGSHNRRRLEP